MNPAPGSRLAWLLLAAAVLAAGLFQLHNLDIWLHARTGQWILQHGRVPLTNVMSVLHADYPAVDDKWGFQILAHLLLDRLGANACIAARLALLAVLFYVMARTARALGANPWSVLFFLLLAIAAGRSRFTFRPDLVSAVFTLVVVRALLVRHPDGRGAWWLILLQLLWVNVHGYFITGPLTVVAVALARCLQGPTGRAAARRLALLCAGMLLVCVVNPAGVDGALHPLRILLDLREHEDFYRNAIIEFRPTLGEDPRDPFDRSAYVVLGLLAGGLLLAERTADWRAARKASRAGAGVAAGHPAASAQSRSPGSFALPGLALFVLFGAMSLSLRRNMGPFAFVAAPLAAAAWSRRVAPRVPRFVSRLAPPLVTALALLVIWGELTDRTSIHDGLDRRSGLGLSAIAYPDVGIDFIARHLPHASVFTAFSYGSTFTGRRWPEQAASTDGNTHGYPTAYLQEVLSAMSGDDPSAFQRICVRDGHGVALLPMAGPLSIQLLADPRWALVCVGVREAVWVARDAVDAEWLVEHDLLARWRAGGVVDLPGTPPGGTLLELRKAELPLAEIDQATLLMYAGLLQAAFARVRAGSGLAPEDAEALALQGLLSARLGRPDEARVLLEASLRCGGFNRLELAARTLLQKL